MISFFVSGHPKPEPRARKGRYGKFYRPRDDSWRSKVAWMAKSYAPKKPLEGAIGLNLGFVMRPPKRLRDDCAFNAIPCANGADLSNLVKNVEDALTTAKVWKDDRQVYRITTSKHYGENPGVHIAITEV